MQLLDFAERLVPADQSSPRATTGHSSTYRSCGLVRTSTSSPSPTTTRFITSAGTSRRQLLTSTASPLANVAVGLHRGYDGGVADAQTALRLHGAAGPGFCADLLQRRRGIDLSTWNSLAVGWFRGINSVLGVAAPVSTGQPTCVDGRSGRCHRRSTTAGFRWAWQTRAWSGGAREPAAVLLSVRHRHRVRPWCPPRRTHVDVDESLPPISAVGPRQVAATSCSARSPSGSKPYKYSPDSPRTIGSYTRAAPSTRFEWGVETLLGEAQLGRVRALVGDPPGVDAS